MAVEEVEAGASAVVAVVEAVAEAWIVVGSEATVMTAEAKVAVLGVEVSFLTPASHRRLIFDLGTFVSKLHFCA